MNKQFTSFLLLFISCKDLVINFVTSIRLQIIIKLINNNGFVKTHHRYLGRQNDEKQNIIEPYLKIYLHVYTSDLGNNILQFLQLVYHKHCV